MTTEPQQARKNPFAFKKAAPAVDVDPRADNMPDASQFALDIQSAQPVKGYTLGAILASSDRTAIFKSHDAVMDRPVVIKMMRPFPGRDGVVEEFFSLAGSIARLRCAGAARGLDVGRADGNFYLVYEFLTGEDLDKKLAKRSTGRMTERESARLVRDIALVLQELFSLGQPHGYLKPSNIMIADSRPRLADIGFAWNLAWPDDDAAFLHAARYLPPERLRGEMNIDVRGDLYSLGAIWFRALTGRDLFEGDTAEEMVRKHCEVRPPTAKSVDPKYTEETSKLIRWLLEKDRDKRPRTPKQFLRHLATHPLLAGDVMDEDLDDGEALQEVPDIGPESEDAAASMEVAEATDTAMHDDAIVVAGPIEITEAAVSESVVNADAVQSNDPVATGESITIAQPETAAAISDDDAILLYSEYASASHYSPDVQTTADSGIVTDATTDSTDPEPAASPDAATSGDLFAEPVAPGEQETTPEPEAVGEAQSDNPDNSDESTSTDDGVVDAAIALYAQYAQVSQATEQPNE